ncbi:MAG: YdeI/OmpD-associated family protein [Planctomycetaceae bacterium]|nr:YdeI/OmpD-associated family protein [Planctomycetaceae bacterium]
MRAKTLKTIDVPNCDAWRQWLAEHHDSESEVWLVFYKRSTGQPSIAYEDAVDEALCFGWIDSLIKRLDDARFARKFTPRKSDSRWSTANRKRYSRLKAGGRLMPAGLARAPTNRSGDAPRPSSSKMPTYIQEALRRDSAARKHFESLAPSYRRQYIAWIDSAKQEATKLRRLNEAIALLAAGKKLGLK